MKTTGHGIEDSRDVANVYHLRLMTLLQELVRDKGYKGRVAGAGDRPEDGHGERQDQGADPAGTPGPGAGVAGGRGFGGGPAAEGSATTGWRNGSSSLRRATRRWAARCAGGSPSSKARSGPCPATLPRAPNSPVPDLPRRTQASRKTGPPAAQRFPRRGPCSGGNIPTWRRGSLPMTTRRSSATPGR